MSVLARVKCAVGKHSGEWSRPGSRCEISRVCDSCGTLEVRVPHVWGQFVYLEADQCDQARRCQRCGSTETRSGHQWGPWLYLNTEFNSPQFRSCRRCHRSERTAPTMR
jgi:hypothetical protein